MRAHHETPRRRRLLWTIALVGFVASSSACSSRPSDGAGGDGQPTNGNGDGGIGASTTGNSDAGDPASGDVDAGLTRLSPTPGIYRRACDGSGAIAIDRDHFLNANDENQLLHVFRRGVDAGPVSNVDASDLMDLDSDSEADIEDLARIGNRVFGITSHGRNSSGEIKAERYRFFGMDISGTPAALSIQGAGRSSKLLTDLLNRSNWTTPDDEVIGLLNQASQLQTKQKASLAPEVDGLNIEGLAALPDHRLVIGFRNPVAPNDKAIIVTFINPDEVLTGGTAKFGEVFRFDLGGLRIRGMAWSPTHNAVLLIGGGRSIGKPFRLFKWSLLSGSSPMPVKDIEPPASGGAPEAIVAYEGTKDVQILFDEGDKEVGTGTCKTVTETSKSFTDLIVHVE